MKKESPKQLLKNPDDVLFKRILDKNLFEVMEKTNPIFSTAEVDFEWRYYRDGKAWLGKAT